MRENRTPGSARGLVGNGESYLNEMEEDMRISGVITAGRILFYTGCTILLVTVAVSVGTALYEWIIPPTDMHLLGLLTAVMIFYVAPLGAILFVIGGLTWLFVFLATRKHSGNIPSNKSGKGTA